MFFACKITNYHFLLDLFNIEEGDSHFCADRRGVIFQAGVLWCFPLMYFNLVGLIIDGLNQLLLSFHFERGIELVIGESVIFCNKIQTFFNLFEPFCANGRVSGGKE